MGLNKKGQAGDKSYLRQWKEEIIEHKYPIILSLILLAISGLLNKVSGTYVDRVGTAVIPDLILDHIPPIDLSHLFVFGYLIVLYIMFLYPLVFKVKQLHVFISQFSLLAMTRSLFMILTHLKIPSDAIIPKFPWLAYYLQFQNDMFFSGHTAFPFLAFLIFKGKIRYFFLASSIIMGTSALLMHQHYSIDILAAYFITYGIYKIGEQSFIKLNHYQKNEP